MIDDKVIEFQKIINKAIKKCAMDAINNPQNKYEKYYSKCMKEYKGSD